MIDQLNKLIPLLRIISREQRKWISRFFIVCAFLFATVRSCERHVNALLQSYLGFRVPVEVVDKMGVALIIIGFLVLAVNHESEAKRIWTVNWGLACKRYPYKKVRHTAIGPVIERSTFLEVLNALRLDGAPTISKIRDELVHDVMTALKQSVDDYSELRDYQYLDLNFAPFESKWELLRLEVKAKADALGVPTGTAN